MTRLKFHKSFGDISAVIRERRRDQQLRHLRLISASIAAYTEAADSMEEFWEETLAPRVPTSHCSIKET